VKPGVGAVKTRNKHTPRGTSGLVQGSTGGKIIHYKYIIKDYFIKELFYIAFLIMQ
jgi:hypothetical protein